MKRQIPIPTHFANGQRTHWPEMILAEIINNKYSFAADHCFFLAMNNPLMDSNFFKSNFPQEKLHHIVPADFECDHGDAIEFLAVTPDGDEFKFAPLVKCTGVQETQFQFASHILELKQKGGYLPSYELKRNEVRELIVNEGLPSQNSIKDLYDGALKIEFKLIHWTDKRY